MPMIPEDLKKNMLRVSELVPYVGNAKEHPDWQVDEIVDSIEAFGFNDPVGVWQDIAGHWVIVEGHGRLLAAQKLGMKEIPVIRLDHLDDEARRAYTLVHNKLTMNTDFDMQVLEAELDAIEGFDMTEFGFGAPEFGTDFSVDEELSDAYSQNIGTVEYEPKDSDWKPSDLFSQTDKFDGMIDSLECDEDLKEMLKLRAHWFCDFNFSRIADYYAYQATPEEQRVFEALGLVLLDRDGLIANGFSDIVGSI